MPEVRGTLRTLSIWEPSLDPVFSESLKDPVLERIFALVDVSNGYYVEVGTQSGEQCNTRYLRVRYGFTGLLIDDNFQNAHVNQRRHFITPRNVVDTFRERGVPQHFDLLSLDTDGFEWLLWLKLLAAGYSPRVVVLEYGENLPFAEDVLIRYSSFPIHRSCLSRLQRFARISGGSILSILRLGLAWGYHLIHVVACGTSDLIFVRGDVLEAKDLSFPAADDPAGLCALAAFQCGAGKANCQHSWPWPRPSQELLATAADVLAGDFLLPDTPAERLLEVLC
ncbi:unnamed protein product [Effrenium voratum]|nr:unnamed protein product [Effrenium voratum]CAJ1426113.1 unnamed protein product [Effrenium voratum]